MTNKTTRILFAALLFVSVVGFSHQALANGAGDLDLTFDPGAGTDSTIRAIVTNSSRKILIGGNFMTYANVSRNNIARLNDDGSLDLTFDPGTGANGFVYNLAVQSDGKIVIGGVFTVYDGTPMHNIARLNSDGSLDTTFDTGTGADLAVRDLAIDANGKIIIVGDFAHYNGIARSGVARLNTDGTLDTSFNPGAGADDTIWKVAIDANGQIIIAGDFTTYDGMSQSRIARLNTDGTLDTSFNPGAGPSLAVRAMGIQSDGKIVIGGGFTSYDNTTRNRLARINTDGTLDMTFDPSTGPNMAVLALAIDVNSKIVIGGAFTLYSGIGRNRVARVNTDGTLDTTFDPGTGVESVTFANTLFAIAIQPDDKILIGGVFETYNTIVRNRIARLYASARLTKVTPEHFIDPLQRQITAKVSNPPVAIKANVAIKEISTPSKPAPRAAAPVIASKNSRER